MNMTLTCFLGLAAFIGTLISAGTGKLPLWIPVLLLSISLLLTCFGR